MTAAPAPGEAAREVFAQALRGMLVLLGVLTIVGGGLGWWLAGTSGLWGALLGAGLVLLFSGTTVVSMLRTAHSSPQTMAAVVMGAWLAKVLVVLVVLAVLRGMDFYSKPVLGVVVLVGVLGSAVIDYRAVTRGRVPYVEPGT